MIESRGSTKSRNIRFDGRRTSVRLELAEWSALREIMSVEGVNLGQICALVDRNRDEDAFTSGLRVFLLKYFRYRAATGSADGSPVGLEAAWDG